MRRFQNLNTATILTRIRNSRRLPLRGSRARQRVANEYHITTFSVELQRLRSCNGLVGITMIERVRLQITVHVFVNLLLDKQSRTPVIVFIIKFCYYFED